jgi:predicted dehydrogenase
LTLKIIQVGMGGWGLYWGAAVRRTNEVILAACVDMSPAALALAQARLEVPLERCFESLAEALDAVECDAVLITSALAAHVPTTLVALAAGKHVLVEKPFAPTLAEAQQAVAAADAYGRILVVSQNYRFFPAVRAVTALVRAGTLGPVGAVNIDFRQYANRAGPEGHRHYTYQQPLLLDMAIHHFDLMRVVLGQEPLQVSCQAFNPPWSKFVDPPAATATISFGGGAMVSYRGSWISPAPKTTWAGVWRVECSGGELFWTSRDGRGVRGDRVTVRPLGRPARRVELPSLPHIDIDGSLANFVQAIHTGHAAENAGRDNLGSLALTLAAIESATTSTPVKIVI